jgi:hypothetical protein
MTMTMTTIVKVIILVARRRGRDGDCHFWTPISCQSSSQILSYLVTTAHDGGTEIAVIEARKQEFANVMELLKNTHPFVALSATTLNSTASVLNCIVTLLLGTGNF